MYHFRPFYSDYIEPARHIVYVMLRQIKHGAPEDRPLLARAHRLQRAALPSVGAVLDFAEHQVFPILRDQVDLPCPAPVIILQDLIPELFQIISGRTLIIRPGLPGTLSLLLLKSASSSLSNILYLSLSIYLCLVYVSQSDDASSNQKIFYKSLPVDRCRTQTPDRLDMLL